MEKIIIIGESGRGKTSLVKEISSKLKIPYFSTDDFYWEIKYNKVRKKEIALDMIKKQYLKKVWVTERTTGWLIEPGLEKADVILFLNFKTIFHQWFSIIKRSLSKEKENETLLSVINLLKHVFYKRYGLGYKKGVKQHKDIIEPYKDKIVDLSSFGDINNFLKSL